MFLPLFPTNVGIDYVACSASPSIASKPADVPQMPLRNQPISTSERGTLPSSGIVLAAQGLSTGRSVQLMLRRWLSLDKEWNKFISQKCSGLCVRS